MQISSLSNPKVKRAVKLRQRSHRDDMELMLVEGFRELSRAVHNGYPLTELFFCPDLFLGENEQALLDTCRDSGTDLYSCPESVFRKLSYRDRPDGLLGIGPQLRMTLEDLKPGDHGHLIVVAEAIEKPGNLGTILRSADGTGATGVIVCDRCTDISNPNVVRASVGTLFTLPVVETSSESALAWLRSHSVTTVATTPDADRLYTGADLSGDVAIIVGAEQYGLSSLWLEAADAKVSIPMRGQADSLNVASATTILLYEALRQRS